jgi:hypothetical protein
MDNKKDDKKTDIDDTSTAANNAAPTAGTKAGAGSTPATPAAAAAANNAATGNNAAGEPPVPGDPWAGFVSTWGRIWLILYVIVVSLGVLYGIYTFQPQCSGMITAANNATAPVNGNSNSNSNTNVNSNDNSNIGNTSRNANTNVNSNANRSVNINVSGNVNRGVNGNANQNVNAASQNNNAAPGTSPTGTNPSATPIPLKIISVSPTKGKTEGNGTVLVKGTGFMPGTNVLFDGVKADPVDPEKMMTATSMMVKSPYRDGAGSVDVAVVNPDGASDILAAGFTYNCAPMPERSLLLIIIFAGALGGIIHALRSLFWYIGNEGLNWKWVPMYILLPFEGALMATIFYLVIYGGFIPTTPTERGSYWFVIGVAVLVGMFSHQAALKLRDLANVALTKPGEGANAIPQTSKPVSTPLSGSEPDIKIVPMKGSIKGGEKIRISGKNFKKITSVNFNGKAVQFSPVPNSNDVEFVVPAAATAGIVDIFVNVEGKTDPIKLTYTYEDV